MPSISRRDLVFLIIGLLAAGLGLLAAFHLDYTLAEALLLVALPVGLGSVLFALGARRTMARLRAIARQDGDARASQSDGALLRRFEELTILHRISLAANSGVGVDQVLQNAVRIMEQTLPYQHLSVFLVDEESETLIIGAGFGIGFEGVLHRRVRVGDGVTGHVVRSGAPLLVNDVSTEPRFIRCVAATRSELCVPMKCGQRVIGGVNVESTEAHAFGSHDVLFLTALANQLAMVVENARLLDEAQRSIVDARRVETDLKQRVEELTTLQQISLRLQSTLDLKSALQHIAESALRLVGANNVHIFLYDAGRSQYTFGMALWADGAREPVFFPRREGITAMAINARQPVIINDAPSHPLFANAQAAAWGLKAIASFPLRRADSAIGALNVAFLCDHVFSPDDLRVLALLADQAAIAVDNSRLHEALAEQAERDSLTQAYNHGHLLQRLHDAVEDARDTTAPLSYIMLDIDNFKQYNDTYGHAIGDTVLQNLVQAIRSNIKHTDTVGRWGGEEFGIVLPGATLEQAQTVARRISAAVQATPLMNDRSQAIPNPTVSQGIASFPEHAASADKLVDAADRALYQAKGAGRNQVVLADALPPRPTHFRSSQTGM